MVHIYYGFGKGKTSILNGSAIRALGANFNVKYIRFLKNRPTSENKILHKLGIEVENFHEHNPKFIWEMNAAERVQLKLDTVIGINRFRELVQDQNVDMLLCDELSDCITNKLVSELEIINILKTNPNHKEILISGHNHHQKLHDFADLVSKVISEKHYFETQKTVARKGVEF